MEKPDSTSDEEWEFEHKQVCGYIRQWVEDNVLNHIANETHARTLWNKLETLDFGSLILCLTLGKIFVVSLTNFALNGIETMKYVKSGVLKEEVQRRTQGSSSSHSEVLVTENRRRNKSKGQGQNGLGDFGTVKMGNDGLAKVIVIGDVCLEMDNGSSLLLRDMKHIPDIRLNMISIGRLDDEGCCNTFSDGQWKLTRGICAFRRDERSKLDMRTRQCIFIGYGLNEFGYRLYDPVEKKLVRSHDVVFMEDQTIQDVEKEEKVRPQYSDGLIDLDPVSFTDLPTNVEHDV
ncbi:hypothetical protein Pint_18583 [Pistacia integerrima]|uniref:Uncharacterized protein n=1 Tax=Pistacia integerrima TaxID=434235 RepID=A0ACC0YW89_9ROSI|nr:hypothetical protein Pint_18583 [Pistacia integerrima]